MNEIGELLSALKHAAEKEGKQFDSKIEACKSLEAYLGKERNFEEGDYIVRDQDYDIYRYPEPGTVQAAKCVKIFDEYRVDQGSSGNEAYNCIIAVAIRKGAIAIFAADTRAYKKA